MLCEASFGLPRTWELNERWAHGWCCLFQALTLRWVELGAELVLNKYL